MIFLNQELRNKLIYKVNRNSTEEKIKSFLFLSEEIQLELHHLQALSRIRFIGWIISRYDSIANLLYFAIVCVNVILIFTVSSVNDRDYNTSSFPGTDLMNILGIFIIFLSVIMYSLSILFSYPVIIFKTFHADFESNLFQSDKNGDMAGTVKMDFVVEKLSKEKGEVVTKYGRFFIYVILNLENFFNVVIILFAGLGWYNPFFYAILLLDILRRSDTLKNVLLVITKNGKSLSLTVVLLCIIVYVYGVWGFAYLGEYYQETDGGNYSYNTYCDTLFNCVTSTFTNGVMNGGGVGSIIYPAHIEDEYYSMRIIFDLSFFIIVVVIVLHIIFGIIVDTFAELRDARKQIVDDIKNICFICGKEKHEFELRGTGWNNHIQTEHNMWAYLAFIIYIRKKPITECDGIEKYVKKKLEQNDINFFPSSALCLIDEKEKTEDSKEIILINLKAVEKQLKSFINK